LFRRHQQLHERSADTTVHLLRCCYESRRNCRDGAKGDQMSKIVNKTKIGLINVPTKGWMILLEINGIDFDSKKYYPSKEDAGIALAAAYPEMSPSLLAEILKGAK
jgi:hypothetical protein